LSVWIYTDADNTLWDTDAVFAEAQLALLSAAEKIAGGQAPTAERLQFVRQFDQAIAERHHSRLRYPPAFLVRALGEGLRGAPVDIAAQRVLTEGSVPTDDEAEALRTYASILSSVPPILEGVRDGLRLAYESGIPVYVISEGSADSVRARLQALELERFTSGALSASKSRDLYARLKQRAAPRRALMIGDQPDRDIQFAHDAGLLTILVRGRFQPSWTQSIDITCADAVVQNFRDAVDWAVKTASSPAF
jgi:putative hydrolase of the HAD superfamily